MDRAAVGRTKPRHVGRMSACAHACYTKALARVERRRRREGGHGAGAPYASADRPPVINLAILEVEIFSVTGASLRSAGLLAEDLQTTEFFSLDFSPLLFFSFFFCPSPTGLFMDANGRICISIRTPVGLGQRRLGRSCAVVSLSRKTDGDIAISSVSARLSFFVLPTALLARPQLFYVRHARPRQSRSR